MNEISKLLEASLFTVEDIHLQDWNSVFVEMKAQTVAALPGEWLKAHLPTARTWLLYTALQQGQWIRVMHGQNQIIQLLEENSIPCVIIKGAAAAMAYPHPTLRSMGDVDVLVKRKDQDSAAELMEANGFILTHDKDIKDHHYNYSKDKINFELHRRLPVVEEANEKLLTLFEEGIDNREWHEIDGYRFPTLPLLLNGLVLILHINQHLREGLGLRQIIDWMMYVNSLSDAQWMELRAMLQRMGIEKLALITTTMCQKYFGLKFCFTGCETVDLQVCDKLMAFIMEKGNFGRKVGMEGKKAAFSLSMTEIGSFLQRLQTGGLFRWKAVKKYTFLRPFAWIYQLFHILGILLKNKMGIKEIQKHRKKGIEQRKLIEALGLRVERTIKYQ